MVIQHVCISPQTVSINNGSDSWVKWSDRWFKTWTSSIFPRCREEADFLPMFNLWYTPVVIFYMFTSWFLNAYHEFYFVHLMIYKPS